MLSSNLFIIGRKCRISTLKMINSVPAEEGSPFKSREVCMPDSDLGQGTGWTPKAYSLLYSVISTQYLKDFVRVCYPNLLRCLWF
jgi:hypothetical protein